MDVSEKIYLAINRAAVLHNGQYRRDKEIPFIVHPFAVGFLLSKYIDDEDVIIAGFLHDVLEDVEGYSRDDMAKDFGDRVADIVEGVSHNKNLEWKERTEKYLERLKGDEDCIMVSCADKIHNITSSIFGYDRFGESFWDAFTAEKKDYHWFYTSVLEIAKQDLNNPIVQELERVIDRANNTVFSSLN